MMDGVGPVARRWLNGTPVMREAMLERRAFLRFCGVTTAGAAIGGTVLAACGDGSSREESSDGGGARGEPAPSVEAYNPDRPYWEQGNFAAVDREITEVALEVSGTLPPLSGLYVRNGSNPPTGRSPHWFLGDGMVHGVRFENGSASWYRNRWVATTMHQQRQDFSAAGVPGREVNQANVAVVHHGGKLLTLGEVGWPYELDPADLSTVGAWDYGGDLGVSMTAHPKVDPDTGEMHFFGYGLTDPLLMYYVAGADGQLLRGEEVPGVPAPMMIHDFAVTDRDVIFWLGPVMVGAAPGDPDPTFPFHWDPSGPSKVGIMPLGGPASEIRWVDIDPCMVFHGLNAHRDGDEVVLRVGRVTSAFGPEGDLLPSYLTEWRVDTSGDRLRFREEQLSDVDMDLPAIDRRHTGRETRHGWFATIDAEGPYGFEFAGLNHVDLVSGREDRWEPGPMERAGEGFFVPEDDGDGEGEGWLLTFLYDRTTDRSSVGVFDAQAVGDGPVARVHLPVRVPYGFHGLWVPEGEM